MSSDTGFSQRACGLCRQRDFRHWWRVDGYGIGRCRSCGLVQVMQDVSEDVLTRLYGAGYYQGETDRVYQNYLADPVAKGKVFGDQFDEIMRRNGPRIGACLEIGCAYGLFLNEVRRRGWAVRGTERSEHAAQWARTELGLDVDSSPDALAKVPDQSQDLVAMWDVVEHLKEPLSVFQEVRRVLRPGGLLVLTTGDVGSIGARIYGRRWYLIAPPYHLFYFDHASMSRLLEAVGLRVKRIDNGGGHPLDNCGRPKFMSWLAKRERYIAWRLHSGPILEVDAEVPATTETGEAH